MIQGEVYSDKQSKAVGPPPQLHMNLVHKRNTNAKFNLHNFLHELSRANTYKRENQVRLRI